jgi:hypothetical protein
LFRYPLPDSQDAESARSPRFLGDPSLHLPCSRTPVRPPLPGRYRGDDTAPVIVTTKALTTATYRGSTTWLLQSLSTLRGLGHPSTPQDSLLADDQSLPGRIGCLQDHDERFQFCSSPFPRLSLARHNIRLYLSPTRARGHVAERRAEVPEAPSEALMRLRAVMCRCAFFGQDKSKRRHHRPRVGRTGSRQFQH